MFKLPSPLPTGTPGEGFSSGTIDLGGLLVSQISTFTKVWATHEGGPDNLGATFFEPSSLPNGFFMLGAYSQANNNKAIKGWVLSGKDATNDSSGSALKPPVDYALVLSSESLQIKQDGAGYIWQPIPPNGYKAVGHIVTTTPSKPPLDKIRCVRADLTDVIEIDNWIWSLWDDKIESNGINVFGSKPKDIGKNDLVVPTGTFVVHNSVSSIACLKNVLKTGISSMPNYQQIQALYNHYSPVIYFHPDEEYFPSSVPWFFDNGALLYTKGQESKPVPIEKDGSNLPQGGSNDGAYWIDLPVDDAAKQRLKKGNVQEGTSYLHVKPMFGATFTDIVVWLFYPFNGPAKAKVAFFNINLGKIGEHVGDWEHVTLRINNFNGVLEKVYFSQHSKGTWMDHSELEYHSGNKPIVYSSLHGHAAYPTPGKNLQGGSKIGIRNDTEKGGIVMDTGSNYTVISADYLGSEIVPPPWLNYAREWGPKISYNQADEIKNVAKVLPPFLRSRFEKFIRKLPNEILGEEGPTGPKFKDNWDGDERA